MRKLFYILLALPLFLFSCNEDDIATFDSDDAGIYFQTGGQTRFYVNIDAYKDSTEFSFSESDETVTEQVLSARLRTLGKVRDYDRKVRVVIDAENTTAIEGTHFRADLNNVIVPAGAAEVEVPITFLRTPDLRTNKIRLTLKVEDNEYFKVPFTKQKDTNVYNDPGDTIKADRYLFLVSEFYVKPFVWDLGMPDYFPNACGEWSVAKQQVLTKLFGFTAYDWSRDGWANGDGKILPARWPYFAVKLRKYLQEMADAGTPVLDDDGSYMQLSEGYEIDYSNAL